MENPDIKTEAEWCGASFQHHMICYWPFYLLVPPVLALIFFLFWFCYFTKKDEAEDAKA
jgi:hypothetical protein